MYEILVLTANLAALLVRAVAAAVLARADDVEGAAVAVLAPERAAPVAEGRFNRKCLSSCFGLKNHLEFMSDISYTNKSSKIGS